jgi:hypothetical protein
MSVTVRQFKNKKTKAVSGWEVDIRLELPNRELYRERVKAPVSAKSAAQQWGEARERDLIKNGPPRPQREVPTLEDFSERFLEDARA